MNCLKRGHFLRECKSVHHCKHCQKPHNTLLHLDSWQNTNVTPDTTVSSNASAGTTQDILLMTCQVWVVGPNGSKVKARALTPHPLCHSFQNDWYKDWHSLDPVCLSPSLELPGYAVHPINCQHHYMCYAPINFPPHTGIVVIYKDVRLKSVPPYAGYRRSYAD